MQAVPDISSYLGQLVGLRRDLHANPELGYREHRTADKIAACLEALGLPVRRGIGGTGVVASVCGRGQVRSGPVEPSAFGPTSMRYPFRTSTRNHAKEARFMADVMREVVGDANNIKAE